MSSMNTRKTMWANIKSLFSSTKTKAQQNLPNNFDQLVKHAITLIENNTTNIDTDEDFLNYLISNGIEYNAAVEILLFLPIAFVRHWLHTVKWSDTYIEYFDRNRSAEKKYSETAAYQIIWNITNEYFNNNPKNETVFKIGARSAEFNVMNKLLNDNPNAILEEVQVSDTVIMR